MKGTIVDMQINSICIIADGYPYGTSSHCVFVRELVSEFAKKGIKCFVIVPQMVMPGRKQYLPSYFEDVITDTAIVKIWAPKYISFSSKYPFMGITMRNHMNAALRVIKDNGIEPDVIYGHFIYLNGLSAISVAKKLNVKSIIACGESTNRLLKGSKPYSIGLKHYNWRKKLSSVNGIISVSTENKEILLRNEYLSRNVPICVLPNAVNTSVFFPRNRDINRKKLGINDSDFVVSFVGHFIQRKGPTRVDEAVSEIEGVKTIFIGSGDFTPKSNCVFCGTVNHDSIPDYLCASDVFVLPTTGEGCCNAIIEALCCGVPVISSEGHFNDDILDDNNSIRIDPLNVEDIKSAVMKLKEEPARLDAMKKYATEMSDKYSLAERADRVIRFIEEVM